MFTKTSMSNLAIRIYGKKHCSRVFSNVLSGTLSATKQVPSSSVILKRRLNFSTADISITLQLTFQLIFRYFTNLLHVCRCAGRPGQGAESHPQSDPQASRWWWSASRCPCRQSQTGPWEAKMIVTVLHKITSSPFGPSTLSAYTQSLWW